ncbi:MAG: DEAD/DEAH box helicase family protein [Clostridiales bacterium]|jgi:type III restriction enzyme|nr:DEAD/DEAH box helicase family protein [Clostridiales bacterium]
MQLKFKKQQFQEDAVSSIVDIFDGQVSSPSTFSVSKLDLIDMSHDNLFGYSNNLEISQEKLQANLNNVQSKNELPNTDLQELRFNIEMETGTGKTFVYIKTIFELNKKYGFSKFVILVPSRAIREGTFKTFQITKQHFKQEYAGKVADYFVYDGKKKNQIRNFATSSTLQVMITTIHAINKDENLFNRDDIDGKDKSDREYLAECKPIMIIDEPQSVDNTDKARNAISMLSPLFELRYSATHKNKINTVYRLTPVDAYQMGIVKQICIANDNIDSDFNKPFMELVEVGNDGRFFAKIKLDVKDKDGSVKRKVLKLHTGKSLQEVTNRDIYAEYKILGIDCTEGSELVEFANTDILYLGKAVGILDEMSLKRNQIKRTIESHLDKEKNLLKKDIKVLSLFFIDAVSNYRTNDKSKGIYAKMFEECYVELINLPKYAELKTRFNDNIEKYHNGYFSKDKKGVIKDTNGDTVDDENTYKLIMQDKEKLLSFESPLRFIWSHSALKEGWDNPNIFNICTLIENKTQFTARQKIGRGLRLCVNQQGERIDDKNINTLTIIARESFAEFAENLQKEIEQETGIKFGILEAEMFVGLTFVDSDKNEVKITAESSKELLEHFRAKDYIDSKGVIKDTMKNALANDTLDLPARFENARSRLETLLKQADKKVEIRQTKERVAVKRKDDLFLDDKFLALWDRIKQKSYYRINTRIDELLTRINNDIKAMSPIEKVSIRKETAKLTINQKGISTTKTNEVLDSEIGTNLLPDVIRILSDNTGTPREQVSQILLQSDRLQDFINNPQIYIEQVQRIIQLHQRTMSIEGIVYTKIDGQEYSLYEVFDIAEQDEVMAYLSNTVQVEKSLYNRVVFDSQIENTFADSLEKDPNVQFFFKIPKRFQISTPVGNYTPDWAVFYKDGNQSKMYFVIETKGSLNHLDLKLTEDIKIHCGEKHFEGVGSGIKWRVAKEWESVSKRA